MKYILLSLAVIITMAACQNKEDVSTVPVVPAYNNSVLSDTAKTEAMEPNFAPSRPKASTVKRTAHTAVHHRVNSETIYHPAIQTPPVVTPVPASPGVNTVPSSTDVGTSTGTTTGVGSTSSIPQVEKKKTWSKAAKGAVIGGVAGAIGGAIISKKKGLGAVIGGVVGAAGGYAIGKKMDKKDNRFVFK
jgi:hypothetical protein